MNIRKLTKARAHTRTYKSTQQCTIELGFHILLLHFIMFFAMLTIHLAYDCQFDVYKQLSSKHSAIKSVERSLAFSLYSCFFLVWSPQPVFLQRFATTNGTKRNETKKKFYYVSLVFYIPEAVISNTKSNGWEKYMQRISEPKTTDGMEQSKVSHVTFIRISFAYISVNSNSTWWYPYHSQRLTYRISTFM